MAPLRPSLLQPKTLWWGAWGLFAALNLLLGLATFRNLDIVIMHEWTTTWLRLATDVFSIDRWAVDYPPNGIVVLAPMALLPLQWSAWCWAFLSIALAIVVPAIAARCIRPDVQGEDLALLTLTFLCWSGTRTVLQFTLLPLAFGLLAWQLASRRPWLSGVLLGLALMKPQVALPVCIWAVASRHWRVGLTSAVTVAALWAVYCIRVRVSPDVVLGEWLTALHAIYAGPDPMTGFSELSSLLPGAVHDRWSPVVVIVLYGLVAGVAMHLFEQDQRDGDANRLSALPGIAFAATLLAFRHVSLAFVSLVPAAAWLLLDGDAATRARRRPLFWFLQVAMIVDLPTIQRRLQFAGVSLGWMDMLMRHADRLFISVVFLALVTLQWSRSREREQVVSA